MKKKSKKPVKQFYLFLVNNGNIFEFLHMIQQSRYKTFKKHCEVNKPVNYVNFIYTFGTGRGKGLIFLNDIWKELNNKWLEHLKTTKNEKEKPRKQSNFL